MPYTPSETDLNAQTAVVIVHSDGPDPGPAEALGEPGHGPGLVHVTGDGPEEVGVATSVAETGAAGLVADLEEIIDLSHVHLFLPQITVK